MNAVDIELRPYRPADWLALLESEAAFAESFSVPCVPGLRAFLVGEDVSEEWRAALRGAPAADPWTHGFAIFDPAAGAVVGNLGFKGPPDPEGCVEIAYGVVPAVEGRGVATAAARAGLEFARSQPGVRSVRAHTLPERNASNAILTKLGFADLGPVEVPDDGTVWRFELAL